MNLDPVILAELMRGGPPLWVSGRTYPVGVVVRSPEHTPEDFLEIGSSVPVTVRTVTSVREYLPPSRAGSTHPREFIVPGGRAGNPPPRRSRPGPMAPPKPPGPF